MDLEQKMVARGATREALKLEAEKEISRQPTTKSRLLAVAAGALIAFTIMVALGPELGPSTGVAVAGFLFSWLIVVVAIFYVAGRYVERQRNRKILESQ